MIKYSVQDNLHPSPVNLFHKFNKKLIACLQVLLIGYTADIARCMRILSIPVLKKFSFILYNLSEMRIHIVIILDIVLVI